MTHHILVMIPGESISLGGKDVVSRILTQSHFVTGRAFSGLFSISVKTVSFVVSTFTYLASSPLPLAFSYISQDYFKQSLQKSVNPCN